MLTVAYLFVRGRYGSDQFRTSKEQVYHCEASHGNGLENHIYFFI